MTIGRIPWSRVRQYGREVYGWERGGEMLEGFWILIATLDVAFAEWMSEEHDKARRQRDAAQKAKAGIGNRSRSKRSYAR